MTAALFTGFFFVGATLAGGYLLELDRLWFALPASAALLLSAAFVPSAPATRFLAGRGNPHWSAASLVLAILAIAPAAIGLFFSVEGEFPFAGDSAFHVSVHYRTALFWISPIGSATGAERAFEAASFTPETLIRSRAVVLTAILAVLFALVRVQRPRMALLFVAATAIGWAFVDSYPYLRYPGLVYFLGVPINLATAVLAPFDTAAGPRIVAFAALPVWLLVLRPLLIGRVPDFRGTAMAVFLFWSQRQIYWQSAPYLETWAICFVLIGLETLYERDRDGAALACLCIGLAACAKEQTILFLPFVWLAGRPWRQGRPPDWTLADWIVLGAAASLPFAFHLALRGQSGGTREIGAYGVNPAAVMEGVGVWTDRLIQHHAGALYLPIAIAVLGLLAALADPVRRSAVIAGFGGLLSILVLYAVDSIGPQGASFAIAGYHRFAEPFLPALALGAGAAIDAFARNRGGLVAFAAWVALNLPGAVEGVRAMASASELRSGFEDGNGAIFVPMRTLLDQARKAGAIDRQSPVDVAVPTPFIAMHPAARFGYDLRFVPAGDFSCVCSSERPAAIATYLVRNPIAGSFAGTGAGAGTEIPVAPGTRGEAGRPPSAFPACKASFETTCRYVNVRTVEGIPTGIIGAGPR